MDEHDPSSLVLRVSRFLGLAPYDTLQRLRVSRRVLLYSYIIHLALDTTLATQAVVYIVALNRLRFASQLWFGNIMFVIIVMWIAIVKGPSKLRNLRDILASIDKTCRAIKYKPTTDTVMIKVCRIYWLVAVSQIIFLFVNILVSQNKTDIKGPGNFMYIVSLHDLKSIFLLSLTMQFVLLAVKIDAVMQGVNRGLKQLYMDLHPRGGLEENEGKFLIVQKELKSCVQFIKVMPKMAATFDYHSAHVRLRSFACAYVSACELADKLENVMGLQLFLFLFFAIATMLQGIYYIIVSMDMRSFSLIVGIKTIMICFLYLCNLITVVSPCHKLMEQVETTRFLVSHISCETSSYSDVFRAELDLFSIHLKVWKPSYNALSLCTIGRPLLLKVVTFIVTSLAIILGL